MSLKGIIILLIVLPVALLGVVAIDDMGEQVSIDSIKRIVCLAPDTAEIVSFLGFESNIVATSIYANYPPSITNRAVIKDLLYPNIEQVLSYKPDIVFASFNGNSPKSVNAIRQAGIPVYTIRINTLKQLVLHLSRLAVYLKADMRRIDRLKREISACYVSKRSVKVFFTMSIPSMYSAGRETIIGDIIEHCGGVNIAKKLKVRYPCVDMEFVIAENPDIIIMTSSINKKAAYNFWKKYRFINAVAKGRLYFIDSDIILRPSPRILIAMKRIATIIRKVSR